MIFARDVELEFPESPRDVTLAARLQSTETNQTPNPSACYARWEGVPVLSVHAHT